MKIRFAKLAANLAVASAVFSFAGLAVAADRSRLTQANGRQAKKILCVPEGRLIPDLL